MKVHDKKLKMILKWPEYFLHYEKDEIHLLEIIICQLKWDH